MALINRTDRGAGSVNAGPRDKRRENARPAHSDASGRGLCHERDVWLMGGRAIRAEIS